MRFLCLSRDCLVVCPTKAPPGTTSDQIHVLGCGNMDPSSVAVGFGGTPSLVRMLWYMCEGFNAYIRHHDLTAL